MPVGAKTTICVEIWSNAQNRWVKIADFDTVDKAKEVAMMKMQEYGKTRVISNTVINEYGCEFSEKCE